MRTAILLPGAIMLVLTGAATAQVTPNRAPAAPSTSPAAPVDAKNGVGTARPRGQLDAEAKERLRQEADARDRKRESRLKRVMGSICGRC